MTDYHKLVRELYDCKETDISLFGVGFHSFVIKLIFPSCRKIDLFDEKQIRGVIEPYTHKGIRTCDSDPIDEKFPDVGGPEIYETLPEDLHETEFAQELKEIIYLKTEKVSERFCMWIYVLLDYLGSLQTFRECFLCVTSHEFLIHLFRFSADGNLVQRVSVNTPEKITEIIDVDPWVFNSYVKKFKDLHILREYLSAKTDPNSLNSYAYMLDDGLGGEKDQKQAREIYRRNWEENKHEMSLSNYAHMLWRGLGGEGDVKRAKELFCEKIDHPDILNNYAGLLYHVENDRKTAMELYKENMEKNNHAHSSFLYAKLLEDKKLIRELLWKNWEKNGHTKSLNNYTVLLYNGQGGETDHKQARELYWKNWEISGSYVSLFNYTRMLRVGHGGEKDSEKARELYKKIWEEASDKDSLRNYINMLENGEGGPIDIELANSLKLSL